MDTSLSGGMPRYFFLHLSDLSIWSFLLECLWLKGRFSLKSLPLELDFFGVVATVFFLVHSVQCGLVCELTWELVGRSVWESCCQMADSWSGVSSFLSLMRRKKLLLYGQRLVSPPSSVARPLQPFICLLSCCPVTPHPNTSRTHS